MSPTYENLNEEGYLIIGGALDPDECKVLSKALVKATMEMVFDRQGYKVDSSDPKSLQLLTDMKYREKVLGENGKGIIYRDGNTRKPLVSKNCGMASMHYIEELLNLVTYNPKLYEESVKVSGTPYLVHSEGPERFAIKAPGATDMSQHIDANLFDRDNSVNYPFRIQSLITLSIDTNINARDSGTLCLLTYFHKYWDFARELFDPKTGISGCRFPEMKSRFFVLPTNNKDNQHFDKNYLPSLKKHASEYSKYVEGERGAAYDSWYKKLHAKGVRVPESASGYLEKMDWKPIPLQPGDMIFWHQHLPHRSLRNRSNVPRICAYYSLYPVTRDWYATKQQKWVQRQFQTCEYYYGVNAGKYPTVPVNTEEIEMMKDGGKIDRIAALSTSTEFHRRITGQESWWAKSEPSAVAPPSESIFHQSIEDPLPTDEEEDEIVLDEEEDEIALDNTPPLIQIVLRTSHWSYAPGLIPDPDGTFDSLLPSLEKVCKTYMVKMYGKSFPSRKVSCLYADNVTEVGERAKAKSNGFDYKETPAYGWSSSPPEILEIKDRVERFFGHKIDYALCHIYRDDTDYIGWHNDKEALNSEIISVSLGASRRFQFRDIGATKGVSEELFLDSGDVVHMHGPRDGKQSCQKTFKHRVPAMTAMDLSKHITSRGFALPEGRRTFDTLRAAIAKYDIVPVRINITFRQYED